MKLGISPIFIHKNKSSQPKQYCHYLAYKTIDNDIDHIRTNVCENSFV